MSRAGLTAMPAAARRASVVGARRLDRDAAHRQRIDHHGGAAGRGGDDADARAARRALRDRHAREQRQALDQAVERLDARDAAVGEERVGDVVLAGERAGVRDRELARRRRAAELVGEDRLAARGGGEREAAQRIGVAHGFEKQHVAVDAGIIERRRADLAEREIDLVADRDQAGEADAARLAARAAARRSCCRECEAAKMRPTGRSVSSKAALAVSIALRAQVDDAEARRPDDADAGARADLAQPRLARRAFGAGLGEAVGQHGRDLHAEPAAFRDRRDRGLGRRHDVGVLGHFRQRRERRPGALAEHGVAPRIDRIDAAGIARPAAEYFSGRPAVLLASSDWPTIATERGASSASRRFTSRGRSAASLGRR